MDEEEPKTLDKVEMVDDLMRAFTQFLNISSGFVQSIGMHLERIRIEECKKEAEEWNKKEAEKEK